MLGPCRRKGPGGSVPAPGMRVSSTPVGRPEAPVSNRLALAGSISASGGMAVKGPVPPLVKVVYGAVGTPLVLGCGIRFVELYGVLALSGAPTYQFDCGATAYCWASA